MPRPRLTKNRTRGDRDPLIDCLESRVNATIEDVVLERTAPCVGGQASDVGLGQDTAKPSAGFEVDKVLGTAVEGQNPLPGTIVAGLVTWQDLGESAVGPLDFSPQRGRVRYLPYPSVTSDVPLAIDQNCQFHHLKVDIQALVDEIHDASLDQADPFFRFVGRIFQFLGKIVTKLDD